MPNQADKQPDANNFLKDKRVFAGAVIALLLGGVISWAIQSHFFPVSAPIVNEVRADSPLYKFANPLLFYKTGASTKYDSLKDQLTTYINSAKGSNDAESVSVYFRDMNSGDWTGINETENYEPASMLKVIYMMSYLKRAEDDPSLFSKQLYYDASKRDEVASYHPAGDDIASGYYSVNDLINYMIVYSDNAALLALASDDNNNTANLLTLFQIPALSSTSTTPDYMSARTYSRIFRVLYDSTYLPWDFSEQALKILSLTDYKDGLDAGVPADTVVAHKFGERTNEDQYGNIVNKELHDCGIIYKANSPYFLCVMTKGQDYTKLQTIISDISKMVYAKE